MAQPTVQQQYRPSGLPPIKTKKYQLPVKLFVRMAMINIIKEFWWAFLVPVAMLIPGLIWGGFVWWFSGALLVTILYLLFWGIQFYGLSQVPAGKPLFEKMFFEIDNKQLLVKKTKEEGMVFQWDQIKRVEKTADSYFFWLSRVQFLQLPFSIFSSDTDIKLTENILKRKKLIPGGLEESRPDTNVKAGGSVFNAGKK
ncbi:MAG: YcxB family protein [Bacteroidota bacterium]